MFKTKLKFSRIVKKNQLMVTVYVIPLRKIVTKLLFSTYFFVLGVKSLVVNPFLKSRKNKLFTQWLYEIYADISKVPSKYFKTKLVSPSWIDESYYIQRNDPQKWLSNSYQLSVNSTIFLRHRLLKKQFMTINTLIYKCAQVNAQRETDYLSESTYYFRFLNATFIFMCHLVGFIRCGCNIKYYDCKFHACKQQVHSKFMLRDLFLKISKRVQLLEYKTKISISKLRMKYIGQDFLKGYSKRVLII